MFLFDSFPLKQLAYLPFDIFQKEKCFRNIQIISWFLRSFVRVPAVMKIPNIALGNQLKVTSPVMKKSSNWYKPVCAQVTRLCYFLL